MSCVANVIIRTSKHLIFVKLKPIVKRHVHFALNVKVKRTTKVEVMRKESYFRWYID